MARLMVVVALATMMAWSTTALAQEGGGGGVGGDGGAGVGGAGVGGMGAGGGTAAVDQDQDGFFTPEDCDDGNSAIHPGMNETCNGIDDNCDGTVDEGVTQTFYEDADGDGFGTASSPIQACEALSGFVLEPSDCNDNAPGISPSQIEFCDGIDNDCNGTVDDNCTDNSYYDDGGGLTPSANVVSGLLLAAWLGFGAWRRRRAQKR